MLRDSHPSFQPSRLWSAFFVASTLVGVAACSGGAPGGGTSMIPQPGSVPAFSAGLAARAKHTGTASFTILVPVQPMAGSAYVSPGTQGVGIVSRGSGAGGATTAFFAIDAKKKYCAAAHGGALTCAIEVPVAAGSQRFVVNAYDRATLQSAILSTGSASQHIVAGVKNPVSVAMHGVVAFLQLSLSDTAPALGSAAQIPLLVTAADAGGYAIDGSFDAPIALSDSDRSGATLLSAKSLGSASGTVGLVLDYSGGNLASATITGKTTSALVARVEASSKLTPGQAAIQPEPALIAVAPGSKSFVQVGGRDTTAPYLVTTGADANGNPSCASLVKVQRVSAISFSIVPVAGAVGSCWLATSDSAGHHGSVPIILCRGGASGPAPSPSPGAAPVTATPSDISICPSSGKDKCKNDEARSTVEQDGSNGAFSLDTTCSNNVAAIQLTSTSGDGATYTISGGSVTGKCSATFTGAGGAQGSLNIDVTAGGIGIN